MDGTSFVPSTILRCVTANLAEISGAQNIACLIYLLCHTSREIDYSYSLRLIPRGAEDGANVTASS